LRTVNRARAETDAETTIKKSLDNDDMINVTVLEIVEINPHISQ